MKTRSLTDLNFSGKRALIRVDFNVPLGQNADGETIVADDTRIRSALPTIQHVLTSGGSAILVSHLGRPKGEVKSEFSMGPVGEHLALLTGTPVIVAPEVRGEAVEQIAASLEPGEIMLLENIRFDSSETKNDPDLSAYLGRLADVYVNDAFGTAHHAHASTAGAAAHYDEKAAGFLMQKELDTLRKLTDSPEHPFVAIVGGAKVSDKIGIIETLLKTADHLLIGGAMAYTFLKAQGKETGTSLTEDDRLDLARDLLERAGNRIHLPVDHVCADRFAADATPVAHKDSIPVSLMGLDIGPESVAEYASIIKSGRTIVWNGPMGVFEMDDFSTGTKAIASALVEATEAGAFSVVGGGDSVAAIVGAGLEKQVSHVSTGGGAMLELLEGKTLPGVAALAH